MGNQGGHTSSFFKGLPKPGRPILLGEGVPGLAFINEVSYNFLSVLKDD